MSAAGFWVSPHWGQLLQYENLVIIDWERYLPPGFQAIMASNILEGTVFARVTRHKGTKESPQLVRDLLWLSWALAQHRELDVPLIRSWWDF